MRSGLGARILVVVGFLAASCAYSGWIATRTAFDPSATKSAARTVLGTQAVQRSLGDQLSEQVAKELRRPKTDPRITAAATQALRDTRLVEAFTTAISDTHRALLGDGAGKITLNTRAVTDAVHDALAVRDPKLAARLTRGRPVALQLDTEQLPRLGKARQTAHTIMLGGGLAALLLVGISLLLAHDRRAVARIGRRIAYLSVFPLLIFGALPRFLAGAKGAAPEVGSALLRAYGARVLPSAIALLVAGIVVAVGSLAIRKPTPEVARTPPLERLPVPPDPRLVHSGAKEEMYL